MSQVRLDVVCRQYLAELRRLRKTVPVVSAGRLALHMGVSRSTAKKYLAELVRQGRVWEYDYTHTNGQEATAYIPGGVNNG
jgi:Mn-dependent DtxR family transcriptional regulator